VLRGQKVLLVIDLQNAKPGTEKRQMENLDNRDEKEIEELLKTESSSWEWLQKGRLGKSQHLLYAMKER